jgi:hypothetical protein
MSEEPVEKVFIGSIIISVLTVVISFLVSVIVALVSIRAKFDGFETVTTTMLSFLCSEYFVHSLILKSKYLKSKKDYRLMENINEWSEQLYKMNSYCELILKNSHGEKDLFVVTCFRSINNLYYLLKTAALEQRIEITTDYIINSTGVFEALNVASSKIIELTFPIDGITDEIMQSAEDKKFFETAYKMAENDQVDKIRILLILEEQSLLENEKLLLLCKFYHTNVAYECKYIMKSDFIIACEHNLVPTNSLDFGIYGSKMLFRVEQYDPYMGIYSKNESEVKRYHALYNEVWNFESVTRTIPCELDEFAVAMTPKVFFESLKGIK